jgi:hypothetical protein
MAPLLELKCREMKAEHRVGVAEAAARATVAAIPKDGNIMIGANGVE